MLVWDVEYIRREVEALIAQSDVSEARQRRDRYMSLRLSESEFSRLERHANILKTCKSDYARLGILLLDLCISTILKGGKNEEEVSRADIGSAG